ncbi:MAG: hypothetical protein OXH72_07245 [Caldilineaceae bacterium]|nr:hypothetical protein [Caldilineaceae bacterium]
MNFDEHTIRSRFSPAGEAGSVFFGHPDAFRLGLQLALSVIRQEGIHQRFYQGLR